MMTICFTDMYSPVSVEFLQVSHEFFSKVINLTSFDNHLSHSYQYHNYNYICTSKPSVQSSILIIICRQTESFCGILQYKIVLLPDIPD